MTERRRVADGVLHPTYNYGYEAGFLRQERRRWQGWYVSAARGLEPRSPRAWPCFEKENDKESSWSVCCKYVPGPGVSDLIGASRGMFGSMMPPFGLEKKYESNCSCNGSDECMPNEQDSGPACFGGSSRGSFDVNAAWPFPRSLASASISSW